MKSSENVFCQGTVSNRTDKRISPILSHLLVVLLVSVFFTNSSNNVRTDLIREAVHLLPAGEKVCLLRNVQCTPENPADQNDLDDVSSLFIIPAKILEISLLMLSLQNERPAEFNLRAVPDQSRYPDSETSVFYACLLFVQVS